MIVKRSRSSARFSHSELDNLARAVRILKTIFFVVLCAVAVAALSLPKRAQEEKSIDKGITSEKRDTRLQLKAVTPPSSQEPACDGMNFATNNFNNNIFM